MTFLELKDNSLSPFVLIDVLEPCRGLVICKPSGLSYKDDVVDDLATYSVTLDRLTTLMINFRHGDGGRDTLHEN